MRHPREKAPGQPQRGLLSKSGGGGCGQEERWPCPRGLAGGPPFTPRIPCPRGSKPPPQSQAQGHTLGESLTLHTSEVTGSR